MITSRLLLSIPILLFAMVVCNGQIPAGSSTRSIPTQVEKTEVQVTQIMTRAEDHFRKGKLNLDDNKSEDARKEFDKAVDTILESGLDVRASQRLQTYYLELIERIYREEVPIGHGLSQATTTSRVARPEQRKSLKHYHRIPVLASRDLTLHL